MITNNTLAYKNTPPNYKVEKGIGYYCKPLVACICQLFNVTYMYELAQVRLLSDGKDQIEILYKVNLIDRDK